MTPHLANPRSLKWDKLSLTRLGGWLKKDETPSEKQYEQEHEDEKRPSRRADVPFKFPEEQRLANELSHAERRAFSADRRSTGTSHRNSSPPPKFALRCSAPDSLSPYASETNDSLLVPPGCGPAGDFMNHDDADPHMDHGAPWFPRPPLSTTGDMSDDDDSCDGVDDRIIKHELDTKWILNLSMHFRDNSDRQKFFMTYAEEPNKWRRLTITIDYRNTDPDSLEATLNSLHYQRDKSERIYEAIRDSLAEVQFFDTVTNLRLETTDGQLHVHVTEDVNETIPYPPVSSVAHLDCRFYRDCDIHFESHLSGFVYKVSVSGRVYIKKEIPGPGSVDEFLYEANALCQLKGSQSVIDFAGLITDDAGERVTGLLISYADKGALVDMIYDGKATDDMPWPRRERWAKQIVRGLSEIHELGYVQGDFTVSNVVIDANDDAKIIDINRRGCPVGWEPPELAKLIESGQRVGIYIGVKSDLFQLGMVLWALAEQQDEPEREERPLAFPMPSNPPQYYQDVVRACLGEDPRDRIPAKELLLRFPETHSLASRPHTAARHSYTTHRPDKEYIDPLTAVGHEDIALHRRSQERNHRASSANLSYADVRPPTEYEAASSGSYIVADAGLSAFEDRNQFNNSPSMRPGSSLSLDGDSEHERDPPERHERAWERIYEDGNTRLVNNGALRLDHRAFSANAVEQETVCLSTPRREPLDFLDRIPNDNNHHHAFFATDLAGVGGIQDAEPPVPIPPSSLDLDSDADSFPLALSDRYSREHDLVGLTRDDLDEDPRRTAHGGDSPRFFSPPVHQDSGFHEWDLGLGEVPDLATHDIHVDDEDDLLPFRGRASTERERVLRSYECFKPALEKQEDGEKVDTLLDRRESNSTMTPGRHDAARDEKPDVCCGAREGEDGDGVQQKKESGMQGLEAARAR
ncbi:hypothetical protein IWZ01DRAFT_366885 [Phyllosticta capitalensis]